jgi:hypothetical protein
MKDFMKNKKIIKSILGFVGSLLIGGGIGYVAAKVLIGDSAGDSIDHPLQIKLLMIPLGILAFFITIAFHELGHVFAGVSQNFKFRLFTVGPFMFEKELDKIIFKWNTNFNTFGGLALCLPQDQVNLTKRYAIFVAGGPLASLILGVLTAAPLLLIDFDRNHPAGYLFDFFLFLLSMMTFCIAVATLLPYHTGGFTSDGGKMLTLLRGGQKAEVEVILLSHIASGTAGTRPALYDARLMHHALNLPIEYPSKPYFHGFLYSHYQDIKDLDKTAYHLQAYLDGIDGVPDGYKAALYLEKAWFEARYHKNADLAKEYFNKEKFGPMIPKSQILRVEAAIAFAEDQPELAAAKVNEAIRELPKALDKGSAIAEKEWMEEMLEEAGRSGSVPH